MDDYRDVQISIRMWGLPNWRIERMKIKVPVGRTYIVNTFYTWKIGRLKLSFCWV